MVKYYQPTQTCYHYRYVNVSIIYLPTKSDQRVVEIKAEIESACAEATNREIN